MKYWLRMNSSMGTWGEGSLLFRKAIEESTSSRKVPFSLTSFPSKAKQKGLTKPRLSTEQDGIMNKQNRGTSLLGLRREKTLRGHLICRCPEHQLRMLSHSTVRAGLGPSSRCRRISCFRARTAVFSSICSSWQSGGRKEKSSQSRSLASQHKQLALTDYVLTPLCFL